MRYVRSYAKMATDTQMLRREFLYMFRLATFVYMIKQKNLQDVSCALKGVSRACQLSALNFIMACIIKFIEYAHVMKNKRDTHTLLGNCSLHCACYILQSYTDVLFIVRLILQLHQRRRCWKMKMIKITRVRRLCG